MQSVSVWLAFRVPYSSTAQTCIQILEVHCVVRCRCVSELENNATVRRTDECATRNEPKSKCTQIVVKLTLSEATVTDRKFDLDFPVRGGSVLSFLLEHLSFVLPLHLQGVANWLLKGENHHRKYSVRVVRVDLSMRPWLLCCLSHRAVAA